MARTKLTPVQLNSMWWEELGRVTLSTSGSAMTVSSFTPRKYLKIITNHLQVGATTTEMLRFNNDSGSNYTRRSAVNQGADGTTTSDTGWNLYGDTSQYRHFECEITNSASFVKLGIYFLIVTSGVASAASAPNRVEGIGMWSNTSTQISRVDWTCSTGSFAAGSELIVLGHD